MATFGGQNGVELNFDSIKDNGINEKHFPVFLTSLMPYGSQRDSLRDKMTCSLIQ